METVTTAAASGTVGDGMKRLKTFATYPSDRAILEGLSDLLTLARGRNYPEREVFVSALKSYAARDAFAEAEAMLADQIAAIESDPALDDARRGRRVAELREVFDVQREALEATLARQGVEVEGAKPKGRKK